MVRAALLVVAIASALLSAQAHACLAAGPDGYSTGNVWENKPKDAPIGSTILQLTDLKGTGEIYGFKGMVLEGPEVMKGKRYRFISDASTSCNAWGASEGFVVISGKLEQIGPTIDDEQGFLIAYDYSESWWNWITRLLGMSPWRYAGDIAEFENEAE